LVDRINWDAIKEQCLCRLLKPEALEKRICLSFLFLFLFKF
jgi:hypothetical protein